MAVFRNAGDADSGFQVRQESKHSGAVGVMVGTLSKVPEMAREREWNWDKRLEVKLQKEASMGRDVNLDATGMSFYTVNTAEDRVSRPSMLSTPGEDLLPRVALGLEGCAYALTPRLVLLQVRLPLHLTDPICLACKQERGMLGARLSAARNSNRPYVSKHAHAHS
ncbi:hypothetical protein FIBSPDRAFT_324864 [Athelia psychrophila]|uniref:Uncharacterized protein n=1 Tax=Athelia psychrophila TaxID=1759441 RepID=A0A167WLP8_9AGAM|nr:hypothetical protein FIBSPDRAFT_324864 [Fibularhizoctonia sp. CBS 109695]